MRAYLILYAWLLAVSGIAQFFLTGSVAAGSAWGYAPGWQREIAFFDLTMFAMVVRALRMNELRFQRAVALALVILSSLVGTNHLLAAESQTGVAWVHLFGIAANYGGVAFGIAVLIFGASRKDSGESGAPAIS